MSRFIGSLVLVLFDVVNEYGFCTEQYLPVGKFMFDPNIKKYTPEYVMNIPDNGKYGAFLEVSTSSSSS